MRLAGRARATEPRSELCQSVSSRSPRRSWQQLWRPLQRSLRPRRHPLHERRRRPLPHLERDPPARMSYDFTSNAGGPVEWFDVYGEVNTRYSQVYWTRNDPVPLPPALVKRFDGRTMAITGHRDRPGGPRRRAAAAAARRAALGLRVLPVVRRRRRRRLGPFVQRVQPPLLLVDRRQARRGVRRARRAARPQPDALGGARHGAAGAVAGGGEFHRLQGESGRRVPQVVPRLPRRIRAARVVSVFLGRRADADRHAQPRDGQPHRRHRPAPLVPAGAAAQQHDGHDVGPLAPHRVPVLRPHLALHPPRGQDPRDRQLRRRPHRRRRRRLRRRRRRTRRAHRREHDGVRRVARARLRPRPFKGRRGAALHGAVQQGDVDGHVRERQRQSAVRPRRAGGAGERVGALRRRRRERDAHAGGARRQVVRHRLRRERDGRRAVCDHRRRLRRRHAAPSRNHAKGDLLPPSLTVVSSAAADGVRTVVVRRSVAAPSPRHWALPTAPGGIDVLVANGCGPTLARHCGHAAATLVLVPAAARACVCTPGEKTYLRYMDEGALEFGYRTPTSRAPTCCATATAPAARCRTRRARCRRTTAASSAAATRGS